MNKQLKNGNRDERQLCSLFQEHHYWAYNCPKDSSGSQPIDVIAIKGTANTDNSFTYTTWLVDSKNVRGEVASFPFSRVEPNQEQSMLYAQEWANIQNMGFVIYFERDMDNPRFLSFNDYLSLKEKGEKSVNLNKLPNFKDIL